MFDGKRTWLKALWKVLTSAEMNIEIKKAVKNKESSQTTLEAETDEARDLKMHVTENNEISSKEKSTTNLDLARDRQIRRKTCKHYNRWNEQGSNLRLDAAPIALPRLQQSDSKHG